MKFMKRDDPQRLVEAVAAWLEFEQLCYRTGLFSESYLTFPIGQFLQSRAGDRVRTELEHPVLAPLKTDRGDKPRVDFAVVREDSTVEFAVETKWRSKTPTLVVQLIRDLVRLEMIVHEQDARAVLILGGLSRKLLGLFETKAFSRHPKKPNSKPLLPVEEATVGTTLWLDTDVKYRRALFISALRPFVGRFISRGINITRLGPFPRDARKNQTVVYGFRVNRRDNGRFLPEDVFPIKLLNKGMHLTDSAHG